MTDERLRELERRFKETGSVNDEAAWLVERVRAGDLSEERLELAGYLAHEAATSVAPPKQSVLELARLDEPIVRDDPETTSILDLRFESAWGLGKWGEEAVLRFCIASAWALLDEFDLESDDDSRALEAAEVLLLGGGDDDDDELMQDRLQRLERDLIDCSEDHGRWASFIQSNAHRLAVGVIVVLGDAFSVERNAWEEPEWPPDDVDSALYAASNLRCATEILVPLIEFADNPGDEIADARGKDVVSIRRRFFEAVRSELIQWALGYCDPVRDRVEARKAASD